MLLSACEKGNAELIKTLLESEDIEQKNKKGYTALHISAQFGYSCIIQELGQAGSNINSVNDARQTPLFLACWNSQEESVKALLALGADINLADKRGWTPLIISVYQNQENIVKILLSHGCDVEKKDCFGKQALDRAKTVKMMDLLKAAIAKTRKGKAMPRSARTSPSGTPRSNSEIEIPNNFGEKRAKTPAVKATSCNVKELNINFRKTFRDAVDKKVRESFFNDRRFLFPDLQLLFMNDLHEGIAQQTLEIKSKMHELLFAKNIEILDKMHEILDSSTKHLSKQQIERKERNQDSVDFSIDITEAGSKFKQKMKKRLKNKIESLVKSELMPELLKVRSDLLCDLNVYLDEIYQSSLTKPKNYQEPNQKKAILHENTGKLPLPSFSVAKSLQNFLKLGEIAKT